MPRISRKNIIGKCFHLMTQGINKEKILLDNMWKEKYKELLKKYSLEYKINIISYCIMNNHVHLLVYVDDVNNLSKFMHRINTIYASYYNRENNRVGYVFRNRYQVQTIKDEMHLKTCIVYIHNNPVKAGIVRKCNEYNYSSFYEYIEKAEVISIQVLKEILNINEYPELLEFIIKTHKNEYKYKFLEIEEKINYNNLVKRLKKQKYTNKEIIYELKNVYNLSERKISEYLEISRYQVRKEI